MTSIQFLSSKSTRRVGRFVRDATITRAWVDNAQDHLFIYWATWDHRHGWYDRRDGEVHEYVEALPNHHISSCYAEDGEPLLELDPFENDGRWPIHGIDR